MAKMNKKKFKTKVTKLISEIEDLILEMPYKGDSENESQKVLLTRTLSDFYYAVNGVEDSDFEED